MRNLYQAVFDFELEGQKIAVPEEFITLHNLQFGWSATIQDSIHVLLAFLSNTARRDLKSQEPEKCDLVFELPKNFNEFIEEMDRLHLSLSEEA